MNIKGFSLFGRKCNLPSRPNVPTLRVNGGSIYVGVVAYRLLREKGGYYFIAKNGAAWGLAVSEVPEPRCYKAISTKRSSSTTISLPTDLALVQEGEYHLEPYDCDSRILLARLS